MSANVWVDIMSSRVIPASKPTNKGKLQPKAVQSSQTLRDTKVVPKATSNPNREAQAKQKSKDLRIAESRQTRKLEKSGMKVTSTAGVPRNNQVKGLKLPKGDKSDIIQKRLKKKSPWYTSMEDPLHGADVKIPDATGFETGTLQLVHRNQIVVGSTTNAVDGYRVVTPLPNFTGGGPDCFNWQYTEATSDALDVKWPATLLSASCFPFETSETLRSYSDGVRVVSASITVQSEASLQNNSGMMVGYINPYPDQLFPTGLPLTTYANHYKSGLVPINNNRPCMVKYLPVKQNGGMYDMFYEPTNGVGSAANGASVPFYEMGVLINGAPSGTTFLVTVVVNYEFLPVKNSINILAAKPSPVDAQEVDLVENWVQDMDVVSMTSSAKASSAPSASATVEPGQGTGFGMFAETVLEMLPVLLPLIL